MTRNEIIPFSIAMKREYTLLLADDHKAYLKLVAEVLKKDGFNVEIIGYDDDLLSNIKKAYEIHKYSKAIAMVFDFDGSLNVDDINERLEDCPIKIRKYELLDDNPGLRLKKIVYRLLIYAVFIGDLLEIAGFDEYDLMRIKRLLLEKEYVPYSKIRELYLDIIKDKEFNDNQELAMSKMMIDYLAGNKNKVGFIKGRLYALALGYLREKHDDLKLIMKNKA